MTYFDQLSDTDQARLEAAGTRRRFQAGSALFRAGDTSDWVCLPRSGRVKICTVSESGREIVLAIRGPGDLIGELSALDGASRSADAVAIDPLDALVLDAAAFRRFVETSAPASLLLLRTVMGRLRHADRRRIEFGAYDVEGRVARLLIELADEHGVPADGGVRIALPLTQDELAGLAAASREATARALRALRERGVIRTHRRQVTILDPDALRRSM